MITISRLEKHGNFGNQLFRIAAILSLAKKHKTSSCFPTFRWNAYFNLNLREFQNLDYEFKKEKFFHFHDWDLKENINYDLDGYFQSEKYFDIELIKKSFSFPEDFLLNTLAKKKNLFEKKTILICIRRADYVNHPYYHQVDFSYYLLAIIKNFPDWKDRNLIFTSDSFSYCKYHFRFLKNAHFIDDLSMMEQFALGTKCDDFVISSSTFQWWIAWLGEKKATKIIHPTRVFRGEFAKKNDDRDFFPERWITFDDSKFDLGNEYIILKIKGSIYQFVVNCKYYYFVYLKIFKNFVKKVIRW